MKKLFFLLTITGFMAACNDSAEKANSASGDTTAPAEITPAPDTTATVVQPAVKDSIMQFKDGKVMIMTGGAWSPLSAAVTTTNGRKVSPDGQVSKNGKSKKLEEGMMIDKDGQLSDKDGKPVDNTGWE